VFQILFLIGNLDSLIWLSRWNKKDYEYKVVEKPVVEEVHIL